MKLESYEDAKNWLYSLKNRGATYGIERMEVFAELLVNPQASFPSIHIAGTNGKGSTAAMLESMFRANGYKTGLSTSPHLVRQGERIQVNREILSEEKILEYTRELKGLGDSIEDPEMRPSFFEFMTAMAFLHFQRSQVDIAIVEVGLGGRLDATNILMPELAVITSVGMDHCEILGDTLEKIAWEKAGIVKPGVPTVIGKLPNEAKEAVSRVCEKRGSPLISIEESYPGEESYPETNLSGGYQRINAATATVSARTLSERFKVDENRCLEALKEVNWPARWDMRRMKHRDIIFDVSHNEEGSRWLASNLSDWIEKGGIPLDIVVGIMGDYRARSLMPVIASFARSITLVMPQQSRSASFESLEEFIPDDFEGEIKRGSIEELFPGKGKCLLDQP
ncbi:MAG TPA: bifunctional folylpolyglutamate synthase/dihydrofolate synthase, partial [Opitutae bacterium]|nr:bifunctional folylpolyglutamate synthase/dihydrofolate synthase [Opitutae bacterium]